MAAPGRVLEHDHDINCIFRDPNRAATPRPTYQEGPG
jgi:hypothetical protein